MGTQKQKKGQESQTGQHQDTIAHDAPFPPESKFPAILFAPFGQPEDEVLADAQGTEDAAIDPSQEQGQDDDDGDDQEIPSQESPIWRFAICSNHARRTRAQSSGASRMAR